jgi:hypothetical protein
VTTLTQTVAEERGGERNCPQHLRNSSLICESNIPYPH